MTKNMLYRGSFFLFLLFWLLAGVVQAAPAPSTQIWINGDDIRSEIPPQLVHDRMLIPIYIFEDELDLDISWDAKDRLVTIVDGNKKMELTIDSKETKVNGQTQKLDVAPQIIQDRTFLPF